MDERARRLWAGTEAGAIGYGGVAAVARATGMAISTVRKARDEARAGASRDDVVKTRRTIWSRTAWAARAHAGPCKAPRQCSDYALRASGDFDDYWQYHVAKEYDRNHKSRYADGEVPNPLPAPRGRPRLKLV